MDCLCLFLHHTVKFVFIPVPVRAPERLHAPDGPEEVHRRRARRGKAFRSRREVFAFKGEHEAVGRGHADGGSAADRHVFYRAGGILRAFAGGVCQPVREEPLV